MSLAGNYSQEHSPVWGPHLGFLGWALGIQLRAFVPLGILGHWALLLGGESSFQE
jgi:hypothetical protein